MVEEKKKAVVTFRDAKGREWHPKVTARVIRDFEKVAGIGLFEAVFDVFIAGDLTRDKEVPPVLDLSNKEVFKMMKKVFGHIGNMTYLLYEACRGTRGDVATVTDEFKQDVSYDDFCQAIEKEQVTDALVVALTCLFEFFPELPQAEGGDGSAGSPPEDGPGKTSMSSPGSEE